MNSEMLRLVDCPFQDQGLIRPLITSAGAVVLMCDEGSEVWLHPDDISRDAAIVPTHPDWRVADGINIVPGTTKWAGPNEFAMLIDWQPVCKALPEYRKLLKKHGHEEADVDPGQVRIDTGRGPEGDIRRVRMSYRELMRLRIPLT
jgi:hypothetical protein